MNFEDLVGKTMVTVEEDTVTKEESRWGSGGDCIRFIDSEGETYLLYHQQDCCESVDIEDIAGNLSDLVGSPITMASETDNQQNTGDYGDSETWTFYNLATLKGYVTIRWYGTSNGYYSEGVDFKKVGEESW